MSARQEMSGIIVVRAIFEWKLSSCENQPNPELGKFYMYFSKSLQHFDVSDTCDLTVFRTPGNHAVFYEQVENHKKRFIMEPYPTLRAENQGF